MGKVVAMLVEKGPKMDGITVADSDIPGYNGKSPISGDSLKSIPKLAGANDQK